MGTSTRNSSRVGHPRGPRPRTERTGLGATLAWLRHEAKLSQLELARRTGISPRTIQRYEAGECDPRLDDLGRVADALGVSVGALVPLPPKDRGCPLGKDRSRI